MFGRFARVGLLVALCVILLPAEAAADPVRTWGTCSAREAVDPQYAGLWEYTLDFGWDSTGWEPERLEQVLLFLELSACPCVGEPAYFSFPFTNGTGQDQDGAATRYYYSGHFLETGSPRFPGSGPAVAFEYIDTNSVLTVRGTARLVFLSPAKPAPFTAWPNHLGVVVGDNSARGEVSGAVPSCDCGSSPVEPSTTWGLIKAIFR